MLKFLFYKECGYRKRTPYKSIHTSDYSQALMIATQWLRDGIPYLQARKLNKTYHTSNNNLPVSEPKKKVIIHKKAALADSGMIPQEIAYKCYEPLNPECTMNLCELLRLLKK